MNNSKARGQTKSKERVRDHGEVFTAEREVKAMCGLVKDETERIASRFLAPAYGKRHLDYEKNAVLAASSIYGVDILIDNVIACRERMFGIWNKEYTAVCKKDCSDETREAVRFILSRNIVRGNALTLMCVDENGNDTKEPIVFSEWSFITGSQIQRCDYTFAELLAQDDEKHNAKQQSMFDAKPSDEGKFLKRYISHYRRVQENG